jgi:hypothetical protein
MAAKATVDAAAAEAKRMLNATAPAAAAANSLFGAPPAGGGAANPFMGGMPGMPAGMNDLNMQSAAMEMMSNPEALRSMLQVSIVFGIVLFQAWHGKNGFTHVFCLRYCCYYLLLATSRIQWSSK